MEVKLNVSVWRGGIEGRFEDFEVPQVRTMTERGLLWAARSEVGHLAAT